MQIKHIYIPLSHKYSSNHGLSEKLIKRRLISFGWKLWRGGYLHASRNLEAYPNIIKKYLQLYDIIPKEKLEYLQYLSGIQFGMPDFLCARKNHDCYDLKFVECKLGHEQLSEVQKRCIKILTLKGYMVEVHKVVFAETKVREAFVNIYDNEKKIIEKQCRLKLHY